MTTAASFDRGAARAEAGRATWPRTVRFGHAVAEAFHLLTPGGWLVVQEHSVAGFEDVAHRTATGRQQGILHTFVARTPRENP